MEVWFWQKMVTPHMAHLAVALASRNCKVTYVAQQEMSNDRAEQGWSAPSLSGVSLRFASCNMAAQKLVRLAPDDSIHVCQGVRSNGSIGVAQRTLAKRGMFQWAVMETVDDSGWRGIAKRIEYSRIFRSKGKSLQGVLAIGYKTSNWVTARGMASDQVYPFSYFLPNDKTLGMKMPRKSGPFRFVFVGQLIPRKRVDWLINALGNLTNSAFELWIVGAGTENVVLRNLAATTLGNRVFWYGQLPLPNVPAVIAQADCLVLPSIHDGWGAVASEALMAGTPVVCSDACGVAAVVKESGHGGVFSVNDEFELIRLLSDQIALGVVTDDARQNLATWATVLGAAAGADYLQKIFTHKLAGNHHHLYAPWEAKELLQ